MTVTAQHPSIVQFWVYVKDLSHKRKRKRTLKVKTFRLRSELWRGAK